MTLLRDTGKIEKGSHGYSNVIVTTAVASPRPMVPAART
jgi:hypothetical protein